MKKASVIFFFTALILLWTGCASTKSAVVFDQRDPIALVSVVSNEDINWKGEDPIDPKTVGFFTNRALREDSELAYITSADKLINTAEAIIRDTMAESPLIKLADKYAALNSGAYRNARINKRQAMQDDVNPDGYRLADYRDKNFSRALAEETGLQRSMFVVFDFTKAMVSGFSKNGTCRAEVTMTIIVNNAAGKTIYMNSFSSWSHSGIKVSSGAYLEYELLELFEPVIKELCLKFLTLR